MRPWGATWRLQGKWGQEAYLPVRKSGSGVGSEISSRHWFSRGTVATTRPSGSCWSKPRAKLFCLETEADIHFWVCRWIPLLSAKSISQPTMKKFFLGQKLPSFRTPLSVHVWSRTWVWEVGWGLGEFRNKPDKKVWSEDRDILSSHPCPYFSVPSA